MTDAILTLNTGSSSIKFSLFETGHGGSLAAAAVVRGEIESIETDPHLVAADGVLSESGGVPLPVGGLVRGVTVTVGEKGGARSAVMIYRRAEQAAFDAWQASHITDFEWQRYFVS